MTQQEKRLSQFDKVSAETRELFNKKNIDYGDAFADYGVPGVLVRMGDKLRRYISVTNKGVSLVNDEALRDTLMDLRNYATMAIMLMDEGEEVFKKPLTPSETYKLENVDVTVFDVNNPPTPLMSSAYKGTNYDLNIKENVHDTHILREENPFVVCNQTYRESPKVSCYNHSSSIIGYTTLPSVYKPDWFKHIGQFLKLWK